MSKSNYLGGSLLNEVYGDVAFIPPSTIYIALFVNGTEVSGNSYARVAVSNNTSEWPTASGSPRTKHNANDLSFPAATGSWGTPNIVKTMDAPTGGNVLHSGSINTPVAVGTGDTYMFLSGDLQIVES